MKKLLPGASVKTTCPYCGVGCGVVVTAKEEGGYHIEGDQGHPANYGKLCSKGLALAETIALDGRQFEPLINNVRVSWDTALDEVATIFSNTIRQYGPDSVAIYGSGQLLTEDYYVANKFMKGFIGSANIDTNSRLCMASAVAGYKRAFGSDTVPCVYSDLEQAELIVVVGANPAWCHPVLWQRVITAKEQRKNLKIIVIDPRSSATAQMADLFLPIQPNSDIALFNGLFAYLIDNGATDLDFIQKCTQGFDSVKQKAKLWDLATVSNHTGLSLEIILQFYQLFLQHQKTVTLFSMGVNQSKSGSDKVNAIINCHLLTKRIGQAGMGPFSITGQPNAMGGREVGGLANMLAAHMDFDQADLVGQFWQTDNIAKKPGLKAVDLFDHLANKNIKAIWIMATNPVVSMPNANKIKQALAQCENVIVSDMFLTTDTARFANIFLPAAGWGEKDGTVTNSERRISRQRAFLDAPQNAKLDWWIICEVAKRMGFSHEFSYEKPEDIFKEHCMLSGLNNENSRDFDISGLYNVDYQTMPPVQWPIAHKDTVAQTDKRFFANGEFYTKNKRANFLDIEAPKITKTSKENFILNSGRIRDQWHTMTRTGRSVKLSSHYAEPFIAIHPEDAKIIGILPTTLVEVKNQYGCALVRALITKNQQQGHVFMPMHWNDENSNAARVNALVRADFDKISGQPALKSSQVQLSPAPIRLYGFVVSRQKPQKNNFSYCVMAPCAGGYRTEFADLATSTTIGNQHNCNDMEYVVERLFGLEISTEHVEYHDKKRGIKSLAVFNDRQLDFIIYLGVEPVLASRHYAASLLELDEILLNHRYHLLAGRAANDGIDKGKIICACMSIGQNEILSAIYNDKCHSLEAIGQKLAAGTNCGSCRSEIRNILNEALRDAAE